jgi:branched-chain amino acid transport system permease protein
MNMMTIFGQLMVGLINGSFYALLSLGMAVIFGMLHIVNFAHGTLYMLGAFAAYLGLHYLGLNYWVALIVAPAAVALFGAAIERTMLSRLRSLDPIYGLLLTFGISLVIEGMFGYWFGSNSRPYPPPALLQGVVRAGNIFIPIYRLWIVAASLLICVATWFFVERTRLGGYLRASTENAPLVQAFGVNVPLLVTLTYATAAGLAALAGVFAAPVFQVNPYMGVNLLILVFGVVIIGGMGAIRGAIIAGYSLGIIEGLTKVIYPEASNVVIFVAMGIVILLRPSGYASKEG